MHHHHPQHRPRAFTLIELLIVVAIIAILAAIAVPNFLEAQVRAKVTRVKSDMRTIATAVETYYVDNNAYPTGWEIIVRPDEPASHSLFLLTTPIAYLSNGNIQDPFHPAPDPNPMFTTLQWDPMTSDGRMFSVYNQDGNYIGENERSTWWLLFSVGPDKESGFTYDVNNPEDIEYIVRNAHVNVGPFANMLYDPTNGTVSGGNVFRAGGTMMNPAGQFIMSRH